CLRQRAITRLWEPAQREGVADTPGTAPQCDPEARWSLRPGVRGSAVFALPTAQHLVDSGGAPLFRQDPRPIRPRRIVTHVLEMAALQFGHPVSFFVLVKPGYAFLRHRRAGCATE